MSLKGLTTLRFRLIRRGGFALPSFLGYADPRAVLNCFRGRFQAESPFDCRETNRRFLEFQRNRTALAGSRRQANHLRRHGLYLAVDPQILNATGMDKRCGLHCHGALGGDHDRADGAAHELSHCTCPWNGVERLLRVHICLQLKIPWQPAPGFVFHNGVLFLLLSFPDFGN